MESKVKGVFIDFYLEYRRDGSQGGLTSDDQALAMLEECKRLVAAGYKGAAITYSANEGQTKDLEAAYAAGRYKASIHGANQAQVMEKLEDHLGKDWKDLQLKMRIAPITTIPDAGTDPSAIVKSDLERIHQYLTDGWAILGWENQDSRGTSHPYAIGGGVQHLAAQINAEIQGGLKALAAEFPARA
jgi:hypothetical protein